MISGALSICIISDGTDSIVQSRELATRLSPQGNITQIYKDDPGTIGEPIPASNLAIGVGFNVADTLLRIKKESGGRTKIAIILDPLKNYDDFDFIILPSYEPYKIKGNNVIRTTGLINFVNDNYLAAQKFDYENHPKYQFLRDLKLTPPYLSVIIGGRHTGGNIDEYDAELMVSKVNEIISQKGGTALISTSKRTEIQIPEVLRKNLRVPYFLYDYKSRNTENPYGVFLALANEIMVTGESVRMLSECCSTGVPIRIYCPRACGFQYKPLMDELINGGHAFDFLSHPPAKANRLDEAGRVAEIIKAHL